MFNKPLVIDVQIDRTIPDFRVLLGADGTLQDVRFCGWSLMDWLSTRALERLQAATPAPIHNKYNDWDLYIYDVAARGVVASYPAKNIPRSYERPKLPAGQVWVFGNDLPRLIRALERGEGA